MAGNDTATNGSYVHDEARFAALSQRVQGIEQSVQGLAGQFSAFVAKLDERGRTPWGLIVSVAVAVLLFVTTIGGLAYAPVWASIGRLEATQTKATDRLEQALVRLADTSISRQEMDWRSARGTEDRDRTNQAIAEIRTAMVPRNEWSERNSSRDHEIASLQKQIDLQRADFQTFANSLGNG